MGATANDVLNVARKWIGYSEKNGKYKEILEVYNATPIIRTILKYRSIVFTAILFFSTIPTITFYREHLYQQFLPDFQKPLYKAEHFLLQKNSLLQ